MNRQSRLLVVLALLGIMAAPLLTAHPVTQHLFDAGEKRIPRELEDAAVLALLGLIGASLAPMAGLLVHLRRWRRSIGATRAIARASEPQRAGGVEYYLLPVAAIMFFTTGVFRPRIYASIGARDQLDGETFRAALLHEREHQRRNDSAWRVALSVLDVAFRVLPPVRRTVNRLALDCEIAADRGALAAGAGRRHLFDAVVAATGSPTVISAVGLASVGAIHRLNMLADDSLAPGAADLRPLTFPILALALIPLAAHTLFWVGAVCL